MNSTPTPPAQDWQVKMIDVLYAVVLGRGMFDFATNLGLPHKFENVWSPAFLLFVFTIAVIARDWINYHKLTEQRPHKGYLRFTYDILILFAFFFMLRAADPYPELTSFDFQIFATTWAAYCLLLVLWEVEVPSADMLKDLRDPSKELFWDALFLLVAAAWALFAVLEWLSAPSVYGASIAIIATVLLAAAKYRKTKRW